MLATKILFCRQSWRSWCNLKTSLRMHLAVKLHTRSLLQLSRYSKTEEVAGVLILLATLIAGNHPDGGRSHAGVPRRGAPHSWWSLLYPGANQSEWRRSTAAQELPRPSIYLNIRRPALHEFTSARPVVPFYSFGVAGPRERFLFAKSTASSCAAATHSKARVLERSVRNQARSWSPPGSSLVSDRYRAVWGKSWALSVKIVAQWCVGWTVIVIELWDRIFFAATADVNVPAVTKWKLLH